MMNLTVQTRNQKILTGLKRLVISLFSIYLVVFIFWLLLLATKKYDGDVVFTELFYRPLSDLETFKNVLKQFAPFLIGALAVLICFKVGFINLGVGGQMSATALVIFALANHLNMEEMIGDSKAGWTVLLLLVGIMTAMAIAAFTAALKIYFGVSEILTTIMLNFVFFHVYRFYVSHPEITNSLGKDMTLNEINDLMGINVMVGTVLPLSLFFAFFIVMVMIFVLHRTIYGFKIKVLGVNQKAVNYAGINRNRYLLVLIILSGFLAGVAGVFYYYRDFDNTYLFKDQALPTNGFDTISIVWLAQGSIFIIPFVTFFVAMLRYQQTQIVTSDLPAANVEIILGFILLAVAISNRLLTMKSEEKAALKARIKLFFMPVINYFRKPQERSLV